ncbi:putative signal peptide and transmembrane protein [Rhodopirellula islandica]|uniref:Signal peptide and transmembrane protein n=1 Tax=Rhodopirellula islandica TaxID=595434 RepID=A0A0J1BCQ0_RHOIS|nr:hypothetical protein [Rhodopirellula islandica]KLU04348.1 putative signal peptide and transmembrane protein [Rhodopirellula islandica]
MAAYDDLNVKRIAVISVISILVTAVTVLAVQVLYFAMADIVDERKVQSASYSRQNAVLADQSAEISRYGVDPETGNVTIPVEDAMKKMVKKAGSQDEA